MIHNLQKISQNINLIFSRIYSTIHQNEHIINNGTALNARDKDGNCVIHSACENGHLPIVQYLIEKQNIDINIKNKYERPPLHCACFHGHLPIVEYLISKGANVKAKDEFGDYIIHYACLYEHLPIVQYLIEQQNVDIDIKGYHEKTPLHYACEMGHLAIAEYLISKGANVHLKDGGGNTPFDTIQSILQNKHIL